MNLDRLAKHELSIQLNNSDTSVLYTSTRRFQAINDAVIEFADLTECFTKQSSVSLSCNTAEYMLLSSTGGSTDFVRFATQGVEYHLTDSNGRTRTASGDDFPRRDIEWLNRYEPGWRESTHVVEFPRGYYLRSEGGRTLIGLTERPDVGSSDTAKLLIPYVATPPPMTSTSEEPFTVGGSARTDLRVYHQALPHFAAYKLLPLIGDEQGSDRQLQKFLGYVARYTQDQRPKGGTHVTTARSYFRESRRVGSRSSLPATDSRWGVRT